MHETSGFDEFHLYRGPTLVRAMTVIELAHMLLGVTRVRIATATPSPTVRELLVNRFSFTPVEAVVTSSGRCVQHEVELRVLPTTRDASTRRFADVIEPLLPGLRAERTSGRVPLVALPDSVVAAIRLEDEIVSRGAAHAELGIYRGLSSRAIRDMNEDGALRDGMALDIERGTFVPWQTRLEFGSIRTSSARRVRAEAVHASTARGSRSGWWSRRSSAAE